MAEIRLSAIRGRGEGGGGISLVGPDTVAAGSEYTYTISNYDSFSVYEVVSSVGSADIVEDEISLDVPAGTTESIIALTVSRNGSSRVFQVALGGDTVVTPSIVSPAEGTSDVPTSVTIQASGFATAPAGAGVHTSSQWEVARDSGFTDIALSVNRTEGNLTRLQTDGLPRATTLHARVRYVSSAGTSSWSTPVSFTTAAQQISKPSLTIVGRDFDVQETPTFSASAFVVTPAGRDTHVASTWVLRDADTEEVVWRLNSSATNRTRLTLPSDILEESREYSMEVQYVGGFGTSVFSDKLSFVTASSFIPNEPGVPFGGGYYAGRFITGGQEYALIVAPKVLGGESSTTLPWKTSRTTTAGTDSLNDGWANTQAMLSAGANIHPAANFCANLSIGGYTDWYIPSRDELEILYRSFKPTTQNNITVVGENTSSVPPTSNYTTNNPSQSSVQDFQEGGPEAFVSNFYWSSTQASSEYAEIKHFNNGARNSNYKTSLTRLRAVRRVPV